jgi:L-alanine-DL-glutamate epimerase-like enolase superfamily enzyme
LASAIPGTRYVEYLTGSPFIDDLPTTPWKLDQQGMLAIPDAPGLGIDLDPDAVARYTGQQRFLGN